MTLTEKRIGRYQVQGILGSTTLATTYKALDPVANVTVALKILRPYYCETASQKATFWREMERVARLQHNGIARVIETGESDSSLWVASEFIPFKSLREVQASSLPPEAVPAIISQGAQALDYAHSQGVFHGNIKPRNVFVTDASRVLLSDFGLTDLARDVSPLLRATSTTPLPTYTAPEIAQGAPLSVEGDVFSLGVLSYFLLTGKVPFQALDPSAVLAKQLTTDPASPSHVNPRLPSWVDDPLLRALSRRPEQRQKSAGAFAQELERALPNPNRLLFVGVPALASTPALRAVQDGTPPSAEVEATVEHQERTFPCPVCEHPNPVSATHCGACWVSFDLTAGEMERQRQIRVEGIRQSKRRRRIIRGVLFTFLFGVLPLVGLWFTYDFYGPQEGWPVFGIRSASTNLSIQPVQQGWPTIHGDVARTGFLPDPGTLPQGHLKWRFETSEPISSSPAVVEDRVYVSTQDRRILALDAADGSVVWQLPVGSPVDSSPTVAGDYLYVGLRDGRLLALDRNTGRQLWEFDTEGPVFSSATVYDGSLYIGSGSGYFYALDAVTGQQRWRAFVKQWIAAPASVSEGIVVVATVEGDLYVFNASNGKKRYAYPLLPPNTAPAIADDKIFVGSNRRLLYAFDLHARPLPLEQWGRSIWAQLYALDIIPKRPKAKGLLWTANIDAFPSTGTAVASGRVFVATARGTLYAFDSETGFPLWKVPMGSSSPSAPLVAGDVLFLGTNRGDLVAVDVATGKSLWRFSTGGPISSTPAIANGVLYLTSQDGSVYAIE
jgi:outer membrane protein assembly factor BamB